MDINDIKQIRPYYRHLSDDQIVDQLRKHDYPDRTREEIAGAISAKLTPPPEPAAPERNMPGFINDQVINVANSALGIGKTISDFVDPDSAISHGIDGLIKEGQEKQSDKQKFLNAKLQQDLAQADGGLAKAGAYLKHAITADPAQTVSQAAGNFAPFMAVGKLAQAGKLGQTGQSMLSMGVGGVSGAGEVRGNIFEKINSMSDADLLAQSPEYFGLRVDQGLSEKDAKARIGADASRNTPELLAAGAMGALSGKFGVEAMASGVAPKMGRLASAGVGLLDEATQGGVEQVATNVGVQRALPGQSLVEDVPLNMAMEGLPGLLGGGLHGGVGHSASSAPQVPYHGPLSRAANSALETMHREARVLALPAPSIQVSPSGTAFTTEQRNSLMQGVMGDKEGGIVDVTPIPQQPGSPVKAFQGPQEQIDQSLANIEMWGKRANPVPLETAQDYKAQFAEQGKDLTVIPHPAGQGFTVVPSAWVAPFMRSQAQQAPLSGMLPAPDMPAPDAPMVSDAGSVRPQTYGDQAASRATAESWKKEAERKASIGLTPDVEKAQRTRAMAIIQPGDITTPKGMPFRNMMAVKKAAKKAPGEILEVRGGWVIRPAAQDAKAKDGNTGSASGLFDDTGTERALDSGSGVDRLGGDTAVRGGAELHPDGNAAGGSGESADRTGVVDLGRAGGVVDKPLKAVESRKTPMPTFLKTKTVPEMTDEELKEAQAFYGPNHKRAKTIEKEMGKRAPQRPSKEAKDGDLPLTDIRLGDKVSVDGESYTVTGPIKDGRKTVGIVADRDSDTDPLKGVKRVMLRGDDAVRAKIAAEKAQSTPKTEKDAKALLLPELRAKLSDLADRAFDAGDGAISGRIRGFTLGMKETDSSLSRTWVNEVVADFTKRVERLEKKAAPKAAKAEEATKPSTNTIFTEDAAAKAREILRKKLGQMNSGLDPEMMQAGITLAGYHIEKGARTFAAYAKAMLEDLGDSVRPYLKSWYMGVKYDPRASGMDGMSAAADVETADVYAPTNTPVDQAENHTHTADEPTTSEQDDERRDLRGQSPQALDEVAAEDDSRPEESGQVQRGTSDGGQERPADGAGVDAAGVSAGRGRGSRAGAVRVPEARAGRGPDGLGDAGTGRTRKAVPRADGRAKRPGSAESAVTPAAPNVPAQNFSITPDLRLGQGGEVEKFNDNLSAIRTLKTLEAERRRATADEQRVLARYVGWGGLANAFPDPMTGQFKDKWKARGEELQALLAPKEYTDARRSTRNAHYTSEVVVSAMWDAARRLGFRGGLVLEDSMGTGNFVGLKPEDLPGKFIGVEYDNLTSRIAQALYPQAAVLNSGFQKVPVADNAFALNIGNPPFGSESLRFQFKPELQGVSIHNQFFRAGMDAVRPGGLQIKVVSRFLMDAQDKSTRVALARQADLVAAIRLPDTAFKENARTEVVTDIIILRKLTPAEQAEREAIMDAYVQGKQKDQKAERDRWLLADKAPAWVDVDTVRDPLGGPVMTVNRYFAQNPAQIMGVLERSGSTQHGAADITVRLDEPAKLGAMLREAVARLPENVSNIPDEVLAATEERFSLLGDALRIAVANEEVGHMKFDEGGALVRVIEREAPDGGFIMTRQQITEDSPWSEQLSLDDQGRWYKLEVEMGEDGKPVKATDKDGKATRRNVYKRTTYANEVEVPASMRLGKTGHERLKGLVELRDLLKKQLVLETEDAKPAVMEGNRKKLASAYEAFVAKHGPVNRSTNMALAMTMPDGGLVTALEVGYQPERSKAQSARSGLEVQSEKAAPAPILRERVVPKYEPPTKASTAADALAITLAERGRVDMDRIASLRGVTPEAAVAELQSGDKPLVFSDPEVQTWETADAYLSGMVRRKLNAARDAAARDPRFDVNVKALEAVQPEAWTAENVTAQVGATWVPGDVYADFITSLVGGKANVSFSAITNSFTVSIRESDRAKVDQWSTEGAPADYIVNRLLNSQPVVVTYKDENGSIKVDQERTALAQLKGKEIVAEFGDWVFKDGDRRQRLVELFNEKFNTRVNRQFDGSHLKLPGKVPDSIIQMRRHQKNAIWRGIASRFLLLDHVVGAGKTFTGIARAMERRRMGLARKPMIVVPNHLVEQWAADVYRLYPGAKVLAAGQKDFEAKRRRRLFGKIATGDWDIVIAPHSSFGFIGISPETEMRYLEHEMEQAKAAIKEAEEQAEEEGRSGFRKPFGVKEAERLAEKIQARIDKLQSGTRDRLLTFEQLGVDDLTVDEAHEFKNLFYSSRLTGVRGMGDKTGSRKAADLYNKVRVMRENGGAVTFMTGTPISNSAVEMYTMMRYLAADELQEQGLEHFDAWRAQSVEASAAFEPTESGRLKEVTRLGRTWANMRALMDTYYGFTDAVSIEDIKKWFAEDNAGKPFPVPKVAGGDRALVKVKPTAAQEDALKDVIRGFDGLDGIKDPKERNAERLRLMDRARKVSLDIRAVDARATSKEEGGKLQRVSTEIKRIYDKWTPDRGAQLVFLDRSVPKAKGDDKIVKEYDDLVAKRDKALKDGNEEAFQSASDSLEKFDSNEIAELRNAQTSGWNAYQQIKDNLVAMGIPAAEIRFVQEAQNDEQKAALFDAVRGGKVRVLIGSTPRMGAGTNVQDRLVGLHHVDVTWKPSDIEQREGRIIRQGNKLLEKYGPDGFEVEIMAYATERTVDAKMWDLNAQKLRMINGIRKYDGAFSMEFEDEESVSMAEMAALASGNPLLLERVTIESQIGNLELQERAHRRKMYGVMDAIRTAERALSENPERIRRDEERGKVLAERVRAVEVAHAGRDVTVDGKAYTDQAEAMRTALAAVELQQEGNPNARYAVTIDGKRATSKEAINDAIGAALGDSSPFMAKIDGAEYAQRTAAGRELARLVSEAKGALKGQKTIDLGEMFGYKLVADLELKSTARGDTTTAVDVHLVDGERTMATAQASIEGIVQLPTAQGRKLLEQLETDIRRRADYVQNVQYLQGQMERAKRDLPALLERKGEGFPKAEELAAKRRRLEEVVRELSSTAEISPDAKPADAGFSRQDAIAAIAHMDMVEDLVRQLTGRWKNAPEIVVLRSMDEAPEAVRRENDRQLANGATGEPEAFYHQGKAYLLASHMRSMSDVRRAVFHEVLGHLGLRGLYGTEIGEILDQVARARRPDVEAKARQYGMNMKNARDRQIAAEEWLAEIAQENPQMGFVRRAVAAIRSWLRRNVPSLAKMRMTDDEIIRELIVPVQKFIKDGPPDGGMGLLPAFLRDRGFSRGEGRRVAVKRDESGERVYAAGGVMLDAPIESERFEVIPGPGQKILNYAIMPTDSFDVLGNIEVLVENGEPVSILDINVEGRNKGVGAKAVGMLLAAHPTTDMNVSNIVPSAQGFWEKMGIPIQNREEGAAYDGTINHATYLDAQAGRGAQGVLAEDQGPDSQADTPAEGSNSQALGGSEVGFSRTQAAQQFTGKAREAVQDFFGSAGTQVDWLDRTFKTQYAKAEKFPAFGKVFNKVQDYIEGVSALANEAADKAPSILPKLDTFSDLWKNGILNHGLKPEDRKAVAAPVFDGTLEWSRVDGKLVRTDDLVEKAAKLTVDKKVRQMLRDGKVSQVEINNWMASKLDIYDAAVTNRYEREYLTPGVVFTDQELKDIYKLTPEQIGHYREFRASVDESLDQVAAAEIVRLVPNLPDDIVDMAQSPQGRAGLRDAVEGYLGDQNNDLWNQVQDKYLQTEKLKSRGYAPLSRFGKFFVHAVDEDGQTQYFGLAETRSQANKLARELKEEFGQAAQIEQGLISQEQYKLMAAVPLDAMEIFASAIGAEESEVFQKYLQLAKNNRSTMKRLIRRKGTSGYSDDVPRVLANFVTSNARAVSTNLHVKDAKEMAANIREGDIKDEAIKLIQAVTEPEESGAAIRSAMFVNFIGGSIASAMVNVTQPVMMTLPYLSQWGGFAQASKRLVSAASMAMARNAGDSDLRAALKRAEQDGIVSPQEIHHLIQRAAGGLGERHPILQKMAFVWGAPFSLAEQFNRRTSFIAAYQTAMEEGIADPFGFAEKAVIETQGLYNAGNKPNAARGIAGATAMTFKQYSIHYLEWLARMAKSGKEGRKAALLALALLALAAGADGLPFMGDLDDVFDTIGQSMGYDTNTKRWRHKMASEVLGDELGEIMTRGVSASAGMPFDVSGRMSMGNLIPATDLLMKSNTDTARSLAELAGPGGALFTQYRDAVKAVLNGDILEGAKKATPIAVQNFAKGIEMATTGEYRDTRGRKVVDAGPMDAASKFLGFQPADVARESGKLSDIRQSEELARLTEADITDAWARAIVDGDSAAERKALDMRDDWNEKNPDQRIVVKRSQAIKKARQLRMDRKDRYAKTVAPERRSAVKAELSN